MPRLKLTPEQFWLRVTVNKSNECWPWLGRTSEGYGNLTIDKIPLRAHRHAFFITNGFYPPVVCHSCDNPPCCNPEHLFAGTKGLNNRDRSTKGRSCKGEKHPKCKLTDKQVDEIRNLYAAGNTTHRKLATTFSVGQSQIEAIINRKSRI